MSQPSDESHVIDNVENEDMDPNSKKFKYEKQLKRCLKILVHVTVGCYFAYATYHQAVIVQNRSYDDFASFPNDTRCYIRCDIQFCKGYGLLLLIVVFVYLGFFYNYVLKPAIMQEPVATALERLGQYFKKYTRITLIAILIFLTIILTKNHPSKLIGFLAPVLFISLGYLTSTSREDIPWDTVITGITCQYLLAFVFIRWTVGRKIFECLGDKAAIFLHNTDEGSKFVYGEKIIREKVFAFEALSIIFFFSFCISILYYFGIMQWILLNMGWLLHEILGTTVCESVNAAANIFLGVTESPLLFRPYIKYLTASEIHTMMVSGFATASGTILGTYMSFGAAPSHLITSCVMAAPATLALSKLYMPETEESKTMSNNIVMEKDNSENSNLLGAATGGAVHAISIVMEIIANMVAFVAFIAFLNGVVNWLGYLVGLNNIDFEWVFSKIFVPIAWTMGVPWEDCDAISEVIAIKTIINELVAYERLGEYMSSNQIGARSAAIATFALCGFTNPSALGILIGSLAAMAPNKQATITSVAFRAFIVGSFVCFISASFAGILLPEEETAASYRKFFEKRNRLEYRKVGD